MDIELELRVSGTPHEQLRVEALSGVERINELYHFDFDVLVDADVAIEREALQREAWFAIRRGDKQRVFHGIINHVRIDGFRNIDRSRKLQCNLRLVPRAWRMALRRTSRIFQEMSIDEVIRAVLAPYFIPARWVLEHRLPKRHYITQYEETDLEFVERLAAEAGLLYFFEQPIDMPSELSRLTGMTDPTGSLQQLANVGQQQLAGVMGSVASFLPGIVGGPREVMVFSDNAHAYLPLSTDRPMQWQDIVSRMVGAVAQVAEQALGHAGVRGVEAPLGMARDALTDAIGGDEGMQTLHLRDGSGALTGASEWTVSMLSSSRSMQTERFAFREYDPERPNADMSASEHATIEEDITDMVREGRAAIESLISGQSPLSVLQRAAPSLLGHLDQLLPTDQELERYEHHSPYLFPQWEDERREPVRMARAARRRVQLTRADGVAPWLEAGRVFKLDDHGLDRFNRRYVLVEVRHEVAGPHTANPGLYRNQFECVPAEVPYVPERPEHRQVQVCLTATVQASDETNIHTDRGAHVKVRFHWDRGQHHRYNTCFIRVMQPWAGPGYGTLFIPREGSEVVVTFESGDPDRPIILGAVYNGANMPPQPLPANRTRSGLRTLSTPGGEGANELWFEDHSGREQIYLHAQRDFDQLVQHNRTVRVERNERVVIDGEQHRRVQGDVHIALSHDRETHIQHDDTLRVDGRHRLAVHGDVQRNFDSNFGCSVGGNQQIEISGSHQLTVGGNSIARHGGNVIRVVGSADAPRNAVSHVQGRFDSSSTDKMMLSSDKELTLTCGKTVLKLKPDTLEISSPTIVLQADGARLRLMSGAFKAQADDILQGVANKIALKASGAAFALTSEAAIEGSQVLLNSPASAQDAIEQQEPEITTIELVDEEGNPAAGQPYRIVMGDGSEVSGVLDDEGRAEIELDGDGEIFFPGVSDLEEQ